MCLAERAEGEFGRRLPNWSGCSGVQHGLRPDQLTNPVQAGPGWKLPLLDTLRTRLMMPDDALKWQMEALRLGVVGT